MKLGIVGEQGSGKTTLFKFLTGQQVNLAQPNLGTIHVPDKRLDFLATMIKPKKVTHSIIEIIDPPGFTKLSFSFIRPTDALVYVIPYFGEFKNPVTTFKNLNSKLILSDLEICEHSIPKAFSEGIPIPSERGGKTPEEKELLDKCKNLLSKENVMAPLRALELNTAEEKFLRGFGFLTQKPVIIVFNSDPATAGQVKEPNAEFKEFLAYNNLSFLSVNAKFETELTELSAEEQESYRQEFGVAKVDLDKFIELIYQSLNIITFFTVVGSEVKAWQAKEGTQAIQAAGMIHSDIERGFIKAEVMNFEELKSCDSFKTAKEKGLIRLVNKEYEVKDGDVIEFKFNV